MSNTQQNFQPEMTKISVSVNDACKMIGLSRAPVYELMKSKKLKSIKIGRKRLILVEDIHACMRAFPKDFKFN